MCIYWGMLKMVQHTHKLILSLISCSASTTMVNVKSVPLLFPEPDGQLAHATLEEKRLAYWSNFFDWLGCKLGDIRDIFNARERVLLRLCRGNLKS